MKKMIMIAAIAAISSPYIHAEPSRVVYFSIQHNTLCTTSAYGNAFSMNISNISSTPTNITLHLYKKDGTPFSVPGFNVNGVSSDLVPGTPVEIPGNQTVQYYKDFGASNVQDYACSSRPLYGKIVVNGDSGLLIASGEVQGRKMTMNGTVTGNLSYFNSTILVNSGNPF